MKAIKKEQVVKAYESVQELMKGNGPIMMLSPKEMYEIGKFAQYVELLVLNVGSELVVLPEDIDWVVGETQGWII